MRPHAIDYAKDHRVWVDLDVVQTVSEPHTGMGGLYYVAIRLAFQNESISPYFYDKETAEEEFNKLFAAWKGDLS